MQGQERWTTMSGTISPSDSTPFAIGSDVTCTDGDVGVLTRVVIDPIAEAVTHLVVDPRRRLGLGRMVPVELAAVARVGGGIELACTLAEFHALDPAEETQFLPQSMGALGYSHEQAFSWPYYGLGRGGYSMGVGGGYGMAGAGGGMGGLGGLGNATQPVVQDRLPVGKVDIRRGDQVHATDGPIGRVQGVVIDRSDHRMTHVLLQEGHLWGKKDVAIPLTAVTGVTDGIVLNLSRDEVKDLPPVDIEDPATG